MYHEILFPQAGNPDLGGVWANFRADAAEQELAGGPFLGGNASPASQTRLSRSLRQSHSDSRICLCQLRFPLVQTIDEAADHLGDHLQVASKFGVLGIVDEPAPPGIFEKGDALLG